MSRLPLLLTALLLAASAAQAGTPVSLRLMETTDLHMVLTDDDFLRGGIDPAFGLARTATLIAQARQETPNTLLMDAGDLIEGGPMGDTVAAPGGLPDHVVHPAYRVMGMLGYDVGTLGNHEFNYGLDFLSRALQGVPFPVICANAVNVKDQKPFIQPYVILERQLVDAEGKRHPIRVGVLGLVTPMIVVWDRDHLKDRVTALDIGATAARLVPEMKAKGADVVVALVHAGWSGRPSTSASTPMDENAVDALTKVASIDAILFGHTHIVFPGPAYNGRAGADLAQGTINGIPATQAGYWGSHLGIVDLALDADTDGHWHINGGKGSARPIARFENGKAVALVDADPRIAAAVAAERTATIRRLAEPIGVTSTPLNTYFAFLHPDPVSQFIAAAQAWYVKSMLKDTPYAALPVLSAAAPFKAGGRMGIGNFADIPAGPLTARNLADAYPYPNTIQAVQLDGAQVVEWLEMGTNAYNTIVADKSEPQMLFNGNVPSYGFDGMYGGLRYTIDVTQPPRYGGDGKVVRPEAHRIRDVMWQGRPLNPTERFVIATNNYRANGGGQFPNLDGSTVIFSGADEARKVLASYLEAVHTFGATPPDLPWHLAPLPATATVIYETAPAAAAQAQADPALESLGSSENGMLRYRVKP